MNWGKYGKAILYAPIMDDSVETDGDNVYACLVSYRPQGDSTLAPSPGVLNCEDNRLHGFHGSEGLFAIFLSDAFLR